MDLVIEPTATQEPELTLEKGYGMAMMRSHGDDEWANRFRGYGKLYLRALELTKEKLELEKEHSEARKNRKSWRELDNLPAVERARYRAEYDKVDDGFGKRFGAIQGKCDGLGAELLDEKIAEEKAQKSQSVGDLRKAKYLKRTGTPGNYKYEYREPKGSKKMPALAFPGEEAPTRPGAFKVSSKVMKMWMKEMGEGKDLTNLIFKEERKALDAIPRSDLPGLFGAGNIPDAQDAIARDTKGAFRKWMGEVSKKSPDKVGKMLRSKSELAPIYFYSHMMRVSGKDMADIAFKRTFETESGHPGELKKKPVQKSQQLVVDLKKAKGEGSRGGKVVGHTASGKPIYAGSYEHKRMHDPGKSHAVSVLEHEGKAKHHEKEAEKHRPYEAGGHGAEDESRYEEGLKHKEHRTKAETHRQRAKFHSEEAGAKMGKKGAAQFVGKGTKKSLSSFGDLGGRLEKAKFIGPRGGEWADAKHTIPYKEGAKKKSVKKKAKRPAKMKPGGKIGHEAALKEHTEAFHAHAESSSRTDDKGEKLYHMKHMAELAKRATEAATKAGNPERAKSWELNHEMRSRGVRLLREEGLKEKVPLGWLPDGTERGSFSPGEKITISGKPVTVIGAAKGPGFNVESASGRKGVLEQEDTGRYHITSDGKTRYVPAPEKTKKSLQPVEDLDEWLEKAKYIKRTGTPGNYRYEYATPKGEKRVVSSRGAATKPQKESTFSATGMSSFAVSRRLQEMPAGTQVQLPTRGAAGAGTKTWWTKTDKGQRGTKWEGSGHEEGMERETGEVAREITRMEGAETNVRAPKGGAKAQKESAAQKEKVGGDGAKTPAEVKAKYDKMAAADMSGTYEKLGALRDAADKAGNKKLSAAYSNLRTYVSMKYSSMSSEASKKDADRYLDNLGELLGGAGDSRKKPGISEAAKGPTVTHEAHGAVAEHQVLTMLHSGAGTPAQFASAAKRMMAEAKEKGDVAEFHRQFARKDIAELVSTREKDIRGKTVKEAKSAKEKLIADAEEIVAWHESNIPEATKKSIELLDEFMDLEAPTLRKCRSPVHLTPANQREFTAHADAVVRSRIAKGPEDIQIEPGYVTTMTKSSSGELVAKHHDGALVKSVPLVHTQVLCKSVFRGGCDTHFSGALSACPECGAGTIEARGLPPREEIGVDIASDARGLRPPRRPPDVKIED